MTPTLGCIVNISKTLSVFSLRSKSVIGAFIVLVDALPGETEVFEVGAEFLGESLLPPLDPLLVLGSFGSPPRFDGGPGNVGG